MNSIINTLQKNYSLYFIEAWGLGTFMISASLFTILFQHPDLKLVQMIPSDFIRRLFIGMAMGGTAVGIINSAWGKKSGAHINPAVTLVMFLLKKIPAADAVFYMLFQIIGGTLGVYLIVLLFPAYMQHPAVEYVVTIPGKAGVTGALAGESIIAFILMFITLFTSNTTYKNQISYITGILITGFVLFESPYSGFSMNPARTIASAIPSGIWTDWILYMLVPPLCMLAAAITYSYLFHKENWYTLTHYFSTEDKNLIE
jgi:aquaporin Z